MAISRPDDLEDLANPGVTLVEAKQLLAQIQRNVVAAQGPCPEPWCKNLRRHSAPGRVLTEASVSHGGLSEASWLRAAMVSSVM